MPVDAPVDVAFDLALAHGRCVGVRIPAAAADLDDLAARALLPDEQRLAAGLPGLRRGTWVGGRTAMREVLGRLGLSAPPIVSDARGAPVLPPGIAGSITHKDLLAAALVAQESTARVGVDLELDVVRSTDVSSRVLTDGERAELAGLDPDARAREVLLRFSAKEAVYKALDPFVKRYVGFKEISVIAHSDGTARVVSHLPVGEGPFVMEVHWRRFDGLILTTARVMPP